jgi:hypothetical protein
MKTIALLLAIGNSFTTGLTISQIIFQTGWETSNTITLIMAPLLALMMLQLYTDTEDGK